MAPSVMSTLSATYRSRHKVLGYPVDVVDEESAIKVVQAAWQNEKGIHIVTLNAEMVVQAQENQELDRIIRHAHLIIPDGAGVVWALKLAGQESSRLPGIELAQKTLEMACREGRRVALLGGKPEVMVALKEVLPKLYPGIKIVGAQDGYFTKDQEDEIVDELSSREPELVLVALGVPKQEYFIDKWHHSFPEAVMIGVGGSFDVWTGQVKRAPAFFRKFHLEWFYRLMKEPWRARRMMSSLPRFGFQVLGSALKGKGAKEKSS